MKFLTNQKLRDHTTFKIGGEAEYFIKVTTKEDLIKAIKLGRKKGLKITMIGNGSNLLVSDEGIKGLVIKNSTNDISIISSASSKEIKKSIEARFTSLEEEVKSIDELEYDESAYPSVLVELDSGVMIPKAIFSLIAQGITGLEWFAGIPSTIGGACYINLHGGSKYLSDYLVKATILTPDNQVKTVSTDYFDFEYDSSSLKTKDDIVLSVTLKLLRGPKDIALKIAQSWSIKKSHQPQRSAGCIFQNLSAEEQAKLKLPTPSIGYVMDKVLNLKGKKVGQAQISSKHAGFIENLGEATAKDVLELIE